MSLQLLKQQLINADIVDFEAVTLRSGSAAEYYINLKKAYGDPDLLSLLGEVAAKSISPDSTCIAAAGYGGIPLGVATSRWSRLPLAMVRDTQKEHGKNVLVEGYRPSERDRVAIVDDVFTSGSSLLMTAQTIAAYGAIIIGCHVVVTRGDVSGFDMPISYVLSAEELLGSVE